MENKIEKILLICIYLTIFFSLGVITFMFSNKENNKVILNINKVKYDENISN